MPTVSGSGLPGIEGVSGLGGEAVTAAQIEKLNALGDELFRLAMGFPNTVQGELLMPTQQIKGLAGCLLVAFQSGMQARA